MQQPDCLLCIQPSHSEPGIQHLPCSHLTTYSSEPASSGAPTVSWQTLARSSLRPLLQKPFLTLTDSQGTDQLLCLLPFQSRTSERAVSKQITDFLSRSDPCGFKSGYSMETGLSSVTEAVKTARAAVQALVPILLISCT